MLFIKLAWRNIFRNKRRTYITGTAIGLGLASLIFIDALVLGMREAMIETATASYLGHGQIHRAGFRESLGTGLFISEADAVLAELKNESAIAHFTPRVIAMGMIQSPADVSAVGVTGILPASEADISQFDETIKEGAFFKNNFKREAVIGSKLAKTLNVLVGDKVVITVPQNDTGELAQELFQVAGIYSFNAVELDSTFALVKIEALQDMLNIGRNVHEIAFRFKNIEAAEDGSSYFWQKFSKQGNEAAGWPELMPDIKTALELSKFSTFIISIILFSIVMLIIMNTLFMSLYERMFEFGVMRAAGTKPFDMAKLIFYESFSLAAVSSLIGSIIAVAALIILGSYGLDYSGVELSGITFMRPIYPVMNVGQFIYYPLVVLAFTVTAAVYPAVYTARVKIVEAMKKTL